MTQGVYLLLRNNLLVYFSKSENFYSTHFLAYYHYLTCCYYMCLQLKKKPKGEKIWEVFF